jgi:enhancing lycopene biosynthesis protein 2
MIIGLSSSPAYAEKIGVIFSGAGVFDGTEIHEAVFTLLSLERQGVHDVVVMAPNIEQTEVINHLTQQPMEETRNVLVESARIVWGNIHDIKDVNIDELDALIIPGGFGAAKNLSSFFAKGPEFEVNPDVEQVIQGMVEAKKPIGSFCITPVILAKILGENGGSPKLTIGNDEGTAGALQAMGAQHVATQATEVIVDTEYKIVTGPAYMLPGTSMSEVADGIDNVVKEILTLVRQ